MKVLKYLLKKDKQWECMGILENLDNLYVIGSVLRV